MPFTKNDPANDGPLEVWLVHGDRRVNGGWWYFGPTPVAPGSQINVREKVSGRTARARVTGFDPNDELPIAAELITID